MIDWLKKLSSHFVRNGNFFLQIHSLTGLKPKNEQLYKLAFRHSSATKGADGLKLNNQRLEYLGDAVLGAIVADMLYEHYPNYGEGFLTSMRSKIVSRKHLNYLGSMLKLQKHVVRKTARTVNAKSIYGDALEALIGAVYLDHGYDKTKRFIIERIIDPHVDFEALKSRVASHKGEMLEWAQKSKKHLRFELSGCWGESHSRKYEVSLLVNDKLVSTGNGSSKKKAEEEASKIAYKLLLKKAANAQDSVK